MRIELETLISLREFAAAGNCRISLRTFGRGFIAVPTAFAIAWIGDELGSEAGGIWTCRAASDEIHSIIGETL